MATFIVISTQFKRYQYELPILLLILLVGHSFPGDQCRCQAQSGYAIVLPFLLRNRSFYC